MSNGINGYTYEFSNFQLFLRNNITNRHLFISTLSSKQLTIFVIRWFSSCVYGCVCFVDVVIVVVVHLLYI